MVNKILLKPKALYEATIYFVKLVPEMSFDLFWLGARQHHRKCQETWNALRYSWVLCGTATTQQVTIHVIQWQHHKNSTIHCDKMLSMDVVLFLVLCKVSVKREKGLELYGQSRLEFCLWTPWGTQGCSNTPPAGSVLGWPLQPGPCHSSGLCFTICAHRHSSSTFLFALVESFGSVGPFHPRCLVQG